jgi:hypothetical protein
MAESALETGRNALHLALEMAQRSSRGARVAALLVPMATMAVSNAHAIIAQPPHFSQTGGGSFQTFSGSGTGTYSWSVTEQNAGDPYNYAFGITGSNLNLTDIDVPLFRASDVSNPSTPGWTLGAEVADGENFGFTPGTVLDFESLGSNNFNLSFTSAFAPVETNWMVTSNGTELSIDPPTPNDPGTPVPEPGTLALLGVGFLSLIALRRKLPF